MNLGNSLIPTATISQRWEEFGISRHGARTHLGDIQGLVDGLHKVSEVGRGNGYYWHERYQPDGKGGMRAAGPDTYCEYPANLIRIVQEFLLGVDMRLDGSLVLAPAVPDEFWKVGFGQTLVCSSGSLSYRMSQNRVEGRYSGHSPLRLGVSLPNVRGTAKFAWHRRRALCFGAATGPARIHRLASRGCEKVHQI